MAKKCFAYFPWVCELLVIFYFGSFLKGLLVFVCFVSGLPGKNITEKNKLLKLFKGNTDVVFLVLSTENKLLPRTQRWSQHRAAMVRRVILASGGHCTQPERQRIRWGFPGSGILGRCFSMGWVLIMIFSMF